MAKRRGILKSYCVPCGKNRYRYWSMACTIALAQSRKTGVPLRIYDCPVVSKGEGFHITKKKVLSASQEK